MSQIRNSPHWITYRLLTFPALKPKSECSVEVKDKILTGTKISLIKSTVTLWLQLWSRWPTPQGGAIFFLSNFCLKQAYYHVVSHHQQIYYQKNTIILAYNNSINLKPHQWNEVHTSQSMISHYLPLRTLCLIFLYHIDNYKTCRVILQMSQDFVEDCQTLHHANNSYQDIHWYFLIILYSSFFFLSLFCTPILWVNNHSNTVWCFIILSVPLVLMKVKTSQESPYTRGWICSPHIPAWTELYEKITIPLFCYRASRLQFKNICKYHLWNNILYFDTIMYFNTIL